MIAGAVLLAVSVLAGLGGTVFAASRFDVGQFERDVVVEGPETALLPGELRFRITEPLSTGRPADMTVGVGVSDLSVTPLECRLADGSGAAVPLRLAAAGTELLRPPPDSYTVTEQAELGPGEYVLTCGVEGEPSVGRGANFTVGRVLGTDDALGLVVPTLVFLGAIAVGVVAFLVGLVLLVVGLVRARRARSDGPPPGRSPPPATGWPPAS